MVLVQNKYKNTLVGVLRTQITFVTHSSPSCYVTLNSGNLSPKKTDSSVCIILFPSAPPLEIYLGSGQWKLPISLITIL